MLKFGMPTLLELSGLEACTSFCEQQGLDFLELNMNLPEYQPEGFDPDLLRRLALYKGIGLTVHLDETLNVCDFNSDIARAARRTVQKTLELAARLEIPILNLHLPSGVYFTLPEGKVWLFDRYRDHYLRQMEQLRQMSVRRSRSKSLCRKLRRIPPLPAGGAGTAAGKPGVWPDAGCRA